MARSFSTNIEKQSSKIVMQTYEYEPFKFGMEREALIHGYTMEEMYGKTRFQLGRFYGLKHSPEMKKELNKDNFVACLIVVLGFGVTIFYNHRSAMEFKDWLKYYYADLHKPESTN